MTHVVVDARMARASGIGTYIRNTVPRVARLASDWRFTLLVGPGEKANLADWTSANGIPPNVGLVPCECPIYGIREQVELPMRVPKDANLYWATHYNVPLFLRRPLVVTVHDVGHLRLPEFTGNLARHAYARLMFGSVRSRAAGVLFDSAFSRDEFAELVGSSNGNSEVVHLGVDRAWFEPSGDTPPIQRPYFVCVGNIKPHKNLGVVLQAFDRVRRELDARLVIVGRGENFRTSDDAVMRRLKATPGAHVLGELSDDAVRRHVRHATALVSASLYEGFGLPPLEAMAACCPAIVSRSGSLPEVCGAAAEYFDATDSDALAVLMLRAVRDDAWRSALAAKGREHARQFDWDVTARRTHAVLARAVGA